MGDDVKDFPESAENRASVADALERAKVARERREAEQKRRLDELLTAAAAAQEQRARREDERRQRQAEQRARDEDRRQQVEERKRAIWDAAINRRETLLQRERERTERVERARAARVSSRSNTAFAFGSSTPRLLEPPDTPSFFWGARSNIDLGQGNFYDAMVASTTNVMFASAPLTRPASALQLDSENNNRDEFAQPQPVPWSSVARRRTDLVPTMPLPRAPGRAYSMTRLDKIPTQRPLHSASPSVQHLNRTHTRSGETTREPSRPGSAMSNSASGVIRRVPSGSRKSRPVSIACTGVNTPLGGGDTGTQSVATTPSVSRDGTLMAAGDVPRRPQVTSRRPRPASYHQASPKTSPLAPADGKPPLHRKPKQSKDHEKPSRGPVSPSPGSSKGSSVDKELATSKKPVSSSVDRNQVSAIEVTQKLEALKIQNGEENHNQNVDIKVQEEIKDSVDDKLNVNAEQKSAPEQKPAKVSIETEPQKPTAVQPVDVKKEAKKEDISQEKTDDSEMTASMTARRITTEEQAKAALAERRRRAREELEKQAELERQRLQREAEEEAERQRREEERQRREEEEQKQLALYQRQIEEEKLKKAIEAQQQLEREEAERKVREDAERQARMKEEEEKRKAAEEAERLRKEEAEREEKERIARKLRVEAIMARTRMTKKLQKEQKKLNQNEAEPDASQPSPPSEQTGNVQSDNGNAVATGNLLDFGTNQNEINDQTTASTNNKQQVADISPNANILPLETNNGNLQHATEQQPTTVGHVSANFIQSERMSAENGQTKLPENVPKLIDDDFTAHNGNGTHNHPLTLQNAI